MMTSEREIFDFVDFRQFTYSHIEHSGVFTCAEADLYHSDIVAVNTRNFFLCGKKGRRVSLAVTICEKTMK